MSLFPAPAGMIPDTPLAMRRDFSFPRTRGDDPYETLLRKRAQDFSPHPRG